MLKSMIAAALAMLMAGAAAAQAPAEVVFRNVRVFDGMSDRLTAPTSVLVRGNLIAAIGPAAVASAPTATVIEGEGRTLMPGLINAHWHTMLIRPTPEQAIYGDVGFTNLLAGAEARATLMRGFTTRARHWRSEFRPQAGDRPRRRGRPAHLALGRDHHRHSGHGDFRMPSELPRDASQPLSRMEQVGGSMVADSPDAVRQRVREQFMLGASQIKLTAGGGVASPHSPLDVSTFTPGELRAAVDAAGNWGTYVAVHAYTPVAIRRSIDAGVKVIEHAHLIDDATAKYMAERAFGCPPSPSSPTKHRPFRPDRPSTSSKERSSKAPLLFTAGPKIPHPDGLRHRHPVLREQARRQGFLLAAMTPWFTPAEVLRMATSTNGELLALSGLRSPYKGKLGVVEAARWPTCCSSTATRSRISASSRIRSTTPVIMKDGRIFKNSLQTDLQD